MPKKLTVNGIKITIVDSPEQTGTEAAKVILQLLKKKPNANFGLSTGASPQFAYKELIKDLQEHNTDWSQASASDLDEWTSYENPRSCHASVNRDILDHLHLAKKYYFPAPPYEKNTGTKVEQRIKKNGGYDLMVLGVGVNGHLAFCEPGTPFESRTGVFKVAQETLARYAQKNNMSLDQLPHYCFGVGLKTINEANKVLLIAFGKDKAEAIRHALYDVPTSNWPVSSLQLHHNVEFVLDKEAAALVKEANN